MAKLNKLTKNKKSKKKLAKVSKKNGIKSKKVSIQSKKVSGKTSNNLGSMTFDDFLNDGLENDFEIDSDSKLKSESKFEVEEFPSDHYDEEKNFEEDNLSGEDVSGSDQDINGLNQDASESDQDGNESDQDANGSDQDGNESDQDARGLDQEDNLNDVDEIKLHKKSLEKLKETDPEFYKFLQENDKKLLEFGDSESEGEENEETEELHQPTEKLEVASDESDFEPDEEEKSSDDHIITLKMLKTWQNDIRIDKSNKTIACLVRAFHAALCRVSNDENKEVSKYKVDGSAVFNAVIQLCVLELGPAVRKFLGLTTGSKQPPHKCKKFVKVKTHLRSYFNDLLKLLGGVTSSNIITVLLKHLHYMSPLIVSFPNVIKPLLKRLVYLWGTADEAVRVVAFLCILRITSNQLTNHLDTVLKIMYMSYVKNCKFVSTNSLPGINFMRRSLVEMFSLDLNVAYQHVFLYIRQLAIHLRNAITVNKKENVQAVYNWQFVNSLRLWGNLLSVTCNKPQLQPLVYPFVQVCIGTINLVPTTQYYPLRFHIVQILMDLSRDTGVFIPVLPFLLDILTNYDFNKKHQKASMKPLQFTCILRLSKSQLSENGFKDALIDNIYRQMLEYLSQQSHTIAFSDLILPSVMQIKAFIKKCSNQNYCKKMKQILEKIEQNSQLIENERKHVTFNITDFKQIEGWESQIKNKGTPLSNFYESWDKLHQIKKRKEATNNKAIGEYNLPSLKKIKKNNDKKVDVNEPVTLFPSDSESEDATEENENLKKIKKRGKRGGKNVNKKVIDHSGPVKDSGEGDILEDFKISDW